MPFNCTNDRVLWGKRHRGLQRRLNIIKTVKTTALCLSTVQMTAYCGGNGTEVCNAYSKLIIFARLWSKTRNYPCIVLYFERSFAPLATMHAIRIFILWIRLEVRTSNRVKINYVKTPLFPNFESLEPSFDGLDTRLKHLETRFEPRSSNLLGIEYRGSRSRFEGLSTYL